MKEDKVERGEINNAVHINANMFGMLFYIYNNNNIQYIHVHTGENVLYYQLKRSVRPSITRR